MSKHTREPWVVGRYPEGAAVTDVVIGKRLASGQIFPIATVLDVGTGYVDLPVEANAERIVACVNALEGFDPSKARELILAGMRAKAEGGGA